MSKVSMTVKQIRDLGLWDKVSEYLNINPYAINEGQIDCDEVLIYSNISFCSSVNVTASD
jgi:hypothetical protein